MRDTISKYGWIIITVIIIAIILGFSATMIHFVKQASYDYVGGITGALPDDMQKEGRNGGNSEDNEGIAYALILKEPAAQNTNVNNGLNVIPLLQAPENTFMVFTRSKVPYEVGDIYDSETFGPGLIVQNVYTGFETSVYEFDEDNYSVTTPWSQQAPGVTHVSIEETIRPISTAYWFMEMYNCQTMNLAKLDATKVTDMTAMFYLAGFAVYEFVVFGLDEWDVSKVTSMELMFSRAGQNTQGMYLENIENWDTSSVKNMNNMFDGTGLNASIFSLNLSKWNVDNVISHTDFSLDVSSKITEPSWKN